HALRRPCHRLANFHHWLKLSQRVDPLPPSKVPAAPPAGPAPRSPRALLGRPPQQEAPHEVPPRAKPNHARGPRRGSRDAFRHKPAKLLPKEQKDRDRAQRGQEKDSRPRAGERKAPKD